MVEYSSTKLNSDEGVKYFGIPSPQGGPAVIESGPWRI